MSTLVLTWREQFNRPSTAPKCACIVLSLVFEEGRYRADE